MSETAPVEVKGQEEKAPTVVLAEKWSEWFTEYRKFDHMISLSDIGYVRKPEIRKGRCLLVRRLSGLVDSFTKDHNRKLEGMQLSYLNIPLNQLVALYQPGGPSVQTYETTIMASARVFTVEEVANNKVKMSEIGFTMLAVLNEEALAKEPPSRKWSIENNISQTLINLAMVAPTNPLLRSHLTALFGEPPPSDCDTFNKIKDWMEFKFEAPMFFHLASNHRLQQYRPVRQSIFDERSIQQVAASNNVTNQRTAFNVTVERVEHHIGSVSYSRKVIVKGETNVRSQLIIDMVDQCSKFQSILEELFLIIESRVDQDDVMHWNAQEFVNAVDAPIILEDFRPLETNPGKATIDKEGVKTLLIDFLIRYYGKNEAKEITQRT